MSCSYAQLTVGTSLTRSVANLATRSLSRGSATRAAQLLRALGLVCMLCACTNETPTRRLISIAPNTMSSAALVEITITGEGFRDVPRVTLSSRKSVPLQQRYRVELPPSDFSAEVTPSTPTELRFTPHDIEPGVYGVRVVPPLGEALVLENALTVEGPAGDDAGKPAADAGTFGADAGPDASTSGPLPNRAISLVIEPESESLRAGDPPRVFTVHGLDESGKVTTDTGEITYTVSEGSLSDFDPLTATLTPKRTSSGRVSATSSYGLSVTSGTIRVLAGPPTRLTVTPNTLQLTADSEPVQFSVSGLDDFDNEADVGDVTWSVASGAISSLSAQGELDPQAAGVGTVRATSSFGVSALSGEITISAGKAAKLSIAPDSWRGVLGGAGQTFTVTAVDSDGNATSDLGMLSFGVTGPIATIDTETGELTPTVVGRGTVTATSSLGPSAETGEVVVSDPNATFSILALRVSSTLYHGATTRVEVDVRSNDVVDAVLTGLGFRFTNQGSQDISSQYTLVADHSNSDRLAPNVTQTLVYHMSVAPMNAYEGMVYITVSGEAFMSSGTVRTASQMASSNVAYPAFGTALTITAPVPPADRTCVGGRISFNANADLLFSYSWRIPDGMVAPGSSLSDRNPFVDFATVGPKANAVTAYFDLVLLSFPTTLVGTPVFIGTATTVPEDTYPTGRAVFSSPAANANIQLSSFPRSDLIALDPAVPLRQCNNVPVDATGHNELTVFSDRKLIDPAVDTDPNTPGIQVELTPQGGLPALPLIAPAYPLEGPTTFYAEHFEPNSGQVTAAGDQTFNLTGDTQAPSVSFSSPASDCTSACLRTRDPLVFQFSEPIWTDSLSNVRVDLFSGTSCTGMSSDWTNASTRTYDAAEHALYILTPMRMNAYAVRVRIPASVTDASAARNPLPAFSRCVVFSTLMAPATPGTPQLTATPASVFSPDGDQVAETVTWSVSVDAATTLLRLRITRAGKTVFGQLQPVEQAGAHSFTWDGADSTGRIVNNGAYGYAIEAVNRAGTASAPLRGYVEVDSAVDMVTVRRRQ